MNVIMNDGQDEDFFREEKTGAGLLLSPKNILFILKNPVILSSIMYIPSTIPFIQSNIHSSLSIYRKNLEFIHCYFDILEI